ncbi:MAG TPA: hypothetical protein VMS17_06390 [Gemmataceae bacterium]|nr:hypothetical protein [Gemmataceae bacterium]
MTSIPHIPLAPQQLNKFIAVLLAGNPRVRFWAARLVSPRKWAEFRRWLGGGGIDPEEINRSGQPLTSSERAAFSGDMSRMCAIAAVEEQVLYHHASQLHRQARAFAGRFHNPLLDKDECLSLSLEAFHRAVHGYTSDKVPFDHFLARVVRNVLRRAAVRHRPLPLPRRHCQLLLAYDRALVRLGPGISFEDVVAHLGLSEDDVRRLRQARVQVCSLSQGREYNDLANLAATPTTDASLSIAAALELVPDFSPAERLLLEEALHDPARGWKAAAARRLGVSRGTITKVLRRGWIKLQRFLHAATPRLGPVDRSGREVGEPHEHIGR